MGTPYPDFTWGITNTFQIKDFDISFLIQGVQGITLLNGDGDFDTYCVGNYYDNDKDGTLNGFEITQGNCCLLYTSRCV